MKPQRKHNSSQTHKPPRGSQVTSQKKSNKHHEHVPRTLSISDGAVSQHVPLIYQQSILDVFALAFPDTSEPSVFAETLQEIKGHLYNRDFQAAFGKPEYLEVYASRWSAARALAYADIFVSTDRHAWFQPCSSTPQPWNDGTTIQHSQPAANDHDTQSVSAPVEGLTSVNLPQPPAKTTSPLKIACIGGGAGAEIVALAASWRYLNSNHDADIQPIQQIHVPAMKVNILAIDIADWSEPVNKISSAITTPPPISRYASQKVRDTTRALIRPEKDGNVDIRFQQEDILGATPTSLQSMLLDVSLVTIMFTLNELFTTSISKTTTLLLNLTNCMHIDAHLVIVDSPGSYSEVTLGKPTTENQEVNVAKTVKKYPMKWLLDHTLLEVAGKGVDVRWVKIEDEDSKWFRIDEKLGLKYAVDLENCRYQIHVFRKVK